VGAQSGLVWDESFQSNASMSGNQFYLVKLNTSQTGSQHPQVVLVAAATDPAIGVLQNKPAAANRGATVRMLGISKAVSDGSGTAINPGDFVGPNASGVCIKKATPDNYVIGRALMPSTASGTIIDILLFGPGWFRTAA